MLNYYSLYEAIWLKAFNLKYQRQISHTVDTESQPISSIQFWKNPAYGRHQLFRPMRIAGPIQFWELLCNHKKKIVAKKVFFGRGANSFFWRRKYLVCLIFSSFLLLKKWGGVLSLVVKEGWPIRGLELIMWSEGPWEASKKVTWKGDMKQKDRHRDY